MHLSRQPFHEVFLAAFDDRWAGVFRRLGYWMSEQLVRDGLYPTPTAWAVFRGIRDDLDALESTLGEIERGDLGDGMPGDRSLRLVQAAHNLRAELRSLIARMNVVLDGGTDPGRDRPLGPEAVPRA